MKLFVVSDVHGHATAMKEALKRAGFDPEDPEHLFISCGDLFDRGRENRAVWLYVDRLKRKVLIRGNHEDNLEKIMNRRRIVSTDVFNGTDLTVEELFGADALVEDGRLYADHRDLEEIYGFLDSMRNYYETESYIFVHGWLPIAYGDGGIVPHADWRNADREEWASARWLEWHKLYPNRYLEENKTVVCGHRAAAYGSRFDPDRAPGIHTPFYGKGVIAIDSATIVSGQVNVLVLEDRLLGGRNAINP